MNAGLILPRRLSTATSLRPTIYALSTKPGRAAISVIRCLGPHAQKIYENLTKLKLPPKSHRASVRKLYGTLGLLDEALTLFFKAPKTYTGEDILELHVHGGNAIVKAVLSAIRETHSEEHAVRYAENGEFSQRAFLSGRFDLTEVEGVREMIDAETELQRVLALALMTGKNRKELARWREQIVHNVALLTTVIDFGEEHDVEETEELFGNVGRSIDLLILEIETYLKRVKSTEILLRGIKVSLIGPPNAGKLSLLNFMANSDLAIVSEIAGTTRDVVDVPIDIGGYKVVVGDTAGIRDLEQADVIEKEGIRRAKQRALAGDLVLVILPANERVSDEIKTHLKMVKEASKPILVVLNKSDLLDCAGASLGPAGVVERFSRDLNIDQSHIHLVSCKTEHGMDSLRNVLVQSFKSITLSDKSDPVALSARAQDLLENDVLHGLKQFKVWKDSEDVVLASECLRQSVDGIGRITGQAVGVEEILGVVFSSFCIGK